MSFYKRFLALLLAVILVLGVIPTVYAADEPNQDDDNTEATTETTESTDSTSDGDDEDSTYIDTYSSTVVGIEEPTGETPALYADTTGTLWNYDWLVFGLKKTVSANYTDAQGTSKYFQCSHLQWHYVDDPTNLIYCLEPNKEFGYGSGKPGDNVGTGGTSTGTNGQNAWYQGLTYAQRQAIGLVLLYGCPNGLWDSEAGVSKDYRNPNRGYRAATQAILWEIVTGMRSATSPYAATNSAFREAGAGVCVGEDGTDHFLYAYDYISTVLAIHWQVPSFTDIFYPYAPTITLTGNKTTVTDTNRVLYRFDFKGSGDVSFTRNGNDLIITTTGNNIPATPFVAECTMPNEDEATYQLFYSATNSSSQTVIRVFTPAYDPVPAYFKLRGATGSISGTKTTDTGTDLAGWEMKLMKDGEVIATTTTDADGNFSFTNIPEGTYTLVETVPADSDYVCTNNNQTVTVTTNADTPVTVHNKQKLGSITITKTTNTGENIGGWTVVVTDAAGAAVGTYTIPDSGVLTIPDLKPGTYTVTEQSNSDAYWICDTEAKTVTVNPGKDNAVTLTNTHRGKNIVKKVTNTGDTLAGWQVGIYSDADCTQKVLTLTTDDRGEAWTYLEPGTYYAREEGHVDGFQDEEYWETDSAIKVYTVEAGKDITITFSNTHKGKAIINKVTNTQDNLEGWQVGIYTDADCTDKVLTLTTDEQGEAWAYLEPGTYYAKEEGHVDGLQDDEYWVTDNEIKEYVVEAGKETTVTFENTHRGIGAIWKITNTGENAGGWIFEIYSDEACTNIVGTLTSDNNGEDEMFLLPGDYWIKEAGHVDGWEDSPYWDVDTEVKKVTVNAGQTSTVKFHNDNLGHGTFKKYTNIPEEAEGWVLGIYKDPECTVHVANVTTDDKGEADIYLLPGFYYIREEGHVDDWHEDDYWIIDTEVKEMMLLGGETAAVSFSNTHKGSALINKVTNTEDNLEGWQVGIYSDAACTDKILTLTTDENGEAWAYMDPGIYYAKEEGHVDGLDEDRFWICDGEVKRYVVEEGKDTTVTFENDHMGELQIIKALATDGTLAGWQFKVTDKVTGEEISGSPFTTDAEGKIVTGLLQPGEYIVEELIPEGSLYISKSENPQTVTVEEGKTAGVTFTNTLLKGKIEIDKVDSQGNRLAGAKLILEWSEDGETWTPVTFHDGEDVIKGGCSSEGLEDGCLVSTADERVVFDGLHPLLKYRIREIAAPEGYYLLNTPVYIEDLSENLETITKITNSEIPLMPQTGELGIMWLPIIGVAIIGIVAWVLIADIRRKKSH